MKELKVKGQEQLLKSLRAATSTNPPISCLLIGETGTAKTTAIKQIAEEHGKEFIRVNLSGHTDIADLVGRWVVKGSAMEWVDGILTYAMTNGAWINFDEINAALPETLFVLQSVLDNGLQLRLLDKDGTLIHAHPDFRFFATMNPAGGLYGGTKDMNAALLDRFGMVFEVTYVDPATEKGLLIEACPALPEDRAITMVDFANKVRVLKAGEKIMRSVSMRALLQWAELTPILGFYDAFIVAVLNKFTDAEEQKTVRGLFEATEEEFKKTFSKYKVSSYTGLIELTNEKLKKAEHIDKLIENKRKLIEAAYEKVKNDLDEGIKEALEPKPSKNGKAKVAA